MSTATLPELHDPSKAPAPQGHLKFPLNSRLAARELGCERKKLQREALRLGVGYNLRGSAGWRFSQADLAALRRAMTPAPVEKKKRTA